MITNISEKFFTGCQKMKDEGDLKEYHPETQPFSRTYGTKGDWGNWEIGWLGSLGD